MLRRPPLLSYADRPCPAHPVRTLLSEFAVLPRPFVCHTAGSQNYPAYFYRAQPPPKTTQPFPKITPSVFIPRSPIPKLHSPFVRCSAGSQNYTVHSNIAQPVLKTTQPFPKITPSVFIPRSPFPKLHSPFVLRIVCSQIWTIRSQRFGI